MSLAQRKEILENDAYLNTLFAINLRLLRAERGISQADLAAMMGISQRTLQRIERVESDPTLTFLIRAAKALGTDYSNLIVYNEHEHPIQFLSEHDVSKMSHGPSLIQDAIQLDAVLAEVGIEKCFENVKAQSWFSNSEVPLVLSNFFDFYVNAAAVREIAPSFSVEKQYSSGSTYNTRKATMSLMNKLLGRDKSWNASQAKHTIDGKEISLELVGYYRQTEGSFLQLSWVRLLK